LFLILVLINKNFSLRNYIFFFNREKYLINRLNTVFKAKFIFLLEIIFFFNYKVKKNLLTIKIINKNKKKKKKINIKEKNLELNGIKE
jgi:hypothetical protein